MPPGQVIVFFVGLIAIIFAAYYVTYYIGLKASGQSRGRLRNKNINIVDRFSISKDKSFCLVEISGKVYVIGITNQSMTLIDTLDAAAFSEAAAEQRDKPLWQAAPGGRFTGPMTRKLAGFMAKRMGRPLAGGGGAEREPSPGRTSSAERMSSAGRTSSAERASSSGRTSSAERMSSPGPGSSPGGGSFSDSMETAREKDRSGQTGRYRAESTENTENTANNANNANNASTANMANAENAANTENTEVDR